MQELTVIRAERDRLIVATDAGDTFALPIDDALRAEVRRARPAPEHRAHRPSPREIQAHIRSGLSAEEVARLLETSIEDVARFEAPVLAEREHIVGLALSVPVLLGAVDDLDARPSFGDTIRAKLAEAGAVAERWSSWKEPTGWMIKLEFTLNEVEHDARWSFDPRRGALAPFNADATQLSRQGSLPEGLIPRLRALDNAPSLKDDTRFDSGAFGPRRDDGEEEPDAARSAPVAVADAAIKRADEPSVTSAETADLLEALRRRRGQREPAPGTAGSPSSSRSHSPVALFDALEPGFDELPAADDAEPPAAGAATVVDPAQRRRSRPAMPSWDEIVFGARGEFD